MRAELSKLMTDTALSDPKFLVLSGDHGYALFDEIRKKCPDQFINAGIMEQAMVGIAAGLAKLGFRPFIYGLASFIPMRVLEQIKLDFCYPNLPGIILGDGAGLVYSTLGVSHQCAEDVSCLRALPNIKIFSPCDAEELKVCFEESLKHNGPAYIRVGKADRPKVHQTALKDTRAVRTFLPTGLNGRSKAAIVSMGSMVHVGHTLAGELGLASISVPRLKPLCENLLELLEGYDTVITLEEHNRHGGLYSSVCEAYFASSQKHPRLMPLSLEDRFSHLCGSYQYALSEHQMSDKQLFERVKDITR